MIWIFSKLYFVTSSLFFKNNNLKENTALSVYLSGTHASSFLCWSLRTDLILSTSKPRPREIKGILGANGPVAPEVLPVDKHGSFTPTLWRIKLNL